MPEYLAQSFYDQEWVSPPLNLHSDQLRFLGKLVLESEHFFQTFFDRFDKNAYEHTSSFKPQLHN